MFNDVIVVDSAPEPYESLSPYEYMDESGISWVTGEVGLKVVSEQSCTRMRWVYLGKEAMDRLAELFSRSDACSASSAATKWPRSGNSSALSSLF